MSLTMRIILTFIVGTILFIGFPLLAWGFDDVQGFASESIRLAYIVLVLLLNLFASIRIPEIGNPKVKEKSKVERQHFAIIFLQIASIAIVLVGPYSDRRNIALLGDSQYLRFAGLLMYVSGFLIMHYAQYYLGSQFSVEVMIQENHKLITSGPYKYVRHPRYLGIFIFMTGISMIFLSLISLLFSLLTLFILLWRIGDEEKMMAGEFGDEWKKYSDNSYKLFPFVY